MILYKAMVGTEPFSYPHSIVIGFVHVYLETLNEIIAGAIPVVQDKYGTTTEAFSQMLDMGEMDIVYSLFVRDEFIEYTTVQFNRVRSHRMNFVGKNFYEKTIQLATDIVMNDPPEETGDLLVDRQLLKADRVIRQLACIYLNAGIEISKNKDLPLYSEMNLEMMNSAQLDSEIGRLSMLYKEIIDNALPEIDKQLFKALSRSIYLIK